MKSIINSLLLVLVTNSFLFSQNDRLEEAKKYIEQRKFDLAKPILEFLYEEDEENPEVNYLFGEISLRENKYDEAIDYFDVAIEGNDANYRYYYMLGNAYGMKAQNSGIFKAAFAAPKAKDNWERAIALKPDFIDAKIALFQYYLRAPGIMGGDNDKARNIALDFITSYPALGHAYMASYYLNAEDSTEKAEQELRLSLKADLIDSLNKRIIMSNIGVLNDLGYRYLNKKNYPKSKQSFRQAINLAPDTANPYDSMGDYYVAVGKYDSALINYESALKQNPKFAVSKLNKGKMLEKLGRNDEAIKVYKELVEETPDSRYGEEAEDRLDELE